MAVADIINFEQQPLPPYFGDLGDDHLHNYVSIDNRSNYFLNSLQ